MRERGVAGWWVWPGIALGAALWAVVLSAVGVFG